MIDEDLTDSKDNVLIPKAEPEPDDDPLLDPAYNPLIPAGQGVTGPKPEKLVDEIRTLFTENELEIAPGIKLERFAGGNIMLTMGGMPRPLEKLDVADLALIHSALRGRR